MLRARWWLIGVLLAVTVAGSAVAGESQRVQKLDDGLDEIAQQLVKGSPSLKHGLTVAVADFGDSQRQFTALGRHVAEEIITRVARSGSVRAIERAKLPTLLTELRFTESDLFDPGFASRLGKFLGAVMTITGTLTDLGSVVRINARVFNTERGVIEAGAAATVAKDDEVARLLSVKLDLSPLVEERRRDDRNEADVQSAPPESAPDSSVFSNHLIRVTVKSLARTNGRLTLELWYENLTDHNLTLVSARWGRAYATDHRGTYLIGDSGEKWEFEEDSQVGNRYGGTELIPQQRVVNRIVFDPEGRGTDTKLTYVGDYRARWRTHRAGPLRDEEFQVVIRDIEPEGAASVQ